jgi:hypothetical protein
MKWVNYTEKRCHKSHRSLPLWSRLTTSSPVATASFINHRYGQMLKVVYRDCPEVVCVLRRLVAGDLFFFCRTT